MESGEKQANGRRTLNTTTRVSQCSSCSLQSRWRCCAAVNRVWCSGESTATAGRPIDVRCAIDAADPTTWQAGAKVSGRATLGRKNRCQIVLVLSRVEVQLRCSKSSCSCKTCWCKKITQTCLQAVGTARQAVFAFASSASPHRKAVFHP